MIVSPPVPSAAAPRLELRERRNKDKTVTHYWTICFPASPDADYNDVHAVAVRGKDVDIVKSLEAMEIS